VQSLKSVQNFEKTCNENSNNLSLYKKSSVNLFKVIGDAFKWFNPDDQEKEIRFDEIFPYEKLNFWILEQLQDLSSIIEAIAKIEELIRVKEMIIQNINSHNIEIQKLAQSKKSLSAILNNKSKDELLNAKKNLIDNLTADSKGLDIIIPVVSSNLLNIDIPKTDIKSVTTFHKELKYFIQMSVKDFEDIKAQL
jgi:hypothetical protein